MEETASFLESLLQAHGSNYLESLFGPKARNNLELMGGVQAVAIQLSGRVFFVQKETLDTFTMH